MDPESYFYNCSKLYVESLSPTLYKEIMGTVSRLSKRDSQSEINIDLFWLLTSRGWYYDTIPAGVDGIPPHDLQIESLTLSGVRQLNNRNICLTSTNLSNKWHTDFGKALGGGIVQIVVQFGKIEAILKDFCGFRIGYAERRLALGIEIVPSNPYGYFAYRRNAIGGMANFRIAKDTLTTIDVDCPIWLVGLRDILRKPLIMKQLSKRVKISWDIEDFDDL